MSDEIKVGHPGMPGFSKPEHRSPSGGGKMGWVILVVVVILIAVAAVVFRDSLFEKKDAGSATTSTDYQAVFLSNGQVYFGKLTNIHDNYLILKDIYYLQVTTSPALQGSVEQGTQTQQQTQVQLVKLGNELHGPVDQMSINKNHVLFYEDIKEDGRVYKAIKEFQANGGQGATQGATKAPATQQAAPAPVQQPAPTPAPAQ